MALFAGFHLGRSLVRPLLLLALSSSAFGAAPSPAAPTTSTTTTTTSAGAPDKTPPHTAHVVSVYDGDTFTLDTGDKVRLSEVNAPEMRPYEAFSHEARDATEGFVLGKEVVLRYGSTVRDHYGRLIALVEVDGKDLSEHLLELGLAHVFLVGPPDTDPSALLAAQDKARAAGLGIWSDSRYKGKLHITSFHANGNGNDRDNPNSEYLRICNVSAGPIDLTGYTIVDLQGHKYPLPAATVPAGYTFELHSGVGTNQTDAKQPLMFYLQSDYPIWNNDKDRASIFDAGGTLQDMRDHEVKAKEN